MPRGWKTGVPEDGRRARHEQAPPLAGASVLSYSSVMAFLDDKRQRAAVLIVLLGVGLTVALWPFITGLIGAPVLYVIFAPVHRWLARRLKPGVAALLVVLLAVLLVIGPGASFITLVATEAQGMIEGVLRSPLMDRLRTLRVGHYDVGAQLEQLSQRAVSWLGTGVLGLVGTATRLGIQFTVALFGFYYLLCDPAGAWSGVRPFIPFSTESAEVLRKRFKDVTTSTLVGTFLTSGVQGVLVGIAFWVTGLANPVFWGVITVVVAILPVVGSGLVWAPGAASLALAHQYGWAAAMVVWGMVVVGQVDNVVRPMVFRRYARIHPFVTVIGAFAGLQYFGLLGLLIGPLAISYFFELIRMYRAEYLDDSAGAAP